MRSEWRPRKGVETGIALRRPGEIVPPGSQGWSCSLTGRPACASPVRSARCHHRLWRRAYHGPTSTAPSWKGWPMPCARARNAPKSAAASRSPNCVWPAAAARATPPCSLPPMCSGCRPPGRTSTKPPGLGAAMDAAVGVGPPRFRDCRQGDDPPGRAFEPNASTPIYDRLYNEVYLKMYDRLKPFYKVIRDITAK